MKAIIYWAKSGGLANRLRALVGYQALSSCLKVPFYLCWAPDRNCDVEFESLFDASEIKLITEAEKQSMEERHEGIVYIANIWFSVIWKNHAKNRVSWEYFREHVVEHTKRLRPLSGIVNIVEEFSKHHNLSEAAAVHIRMTDNVDSYESWARRSHDFSPECVSRLEGFERFIADTLETKPATKIFLATDNQDVEKSMRKIFAGHIITYPKRYRKQVKLTFSIKKPRFQRQFRRSTSIKDSLVEMLLLGRCRILLGTYWSSYSEFASFWGDTEFLGVYGCEYSESSFMNRIQGKVDS
jgi:hypothetical protein